MTIYYGANEDQAWVEEDRDAQKELQEELDAPRPVEVADSDSFPEITTESEAKAKARKRLGDQSVIQTGTITTPLGFFGTAAGDVFTLSLDDAGIDSEDFRVAQHDYEWSKGTATRTIAENTGGNVDELLVSLSESLTNERLKSADPDAAVTNALRIGTLAEANLSLTVQTKTYGDAFLLGQDFLGVGGPDLGVSVSSTATHGTTASRTTVAGLNLMRDVWREGPTAADPWDCLQVGTSDETPTRTDTELNAPVAEFDGIAESTPALATKTVARIPAGGPVADADPLQEVGVNCTDLYASLTTDPVSISSDTTAAYRLELTIDNNPAGEGVLTLNGSEEWRDLMLGEGGGATTMVYGDDQTAPDVTDAALGNETYSDPIDSSGVGSTGLMRWVDRVADTDTDTSILAEVGQENAAGTLLTRSTFEPYGEAVTVETTHEITVRNP